MRLKSVMTSLIAMSSSSASASSSSSSGTAAMSRKAAIRTRVKEAIQGLSPERIQEHSKAAISKLQSMPEWTSSRVICLYLSMAPEIQTYDCIKHAFDEGKQVYIPKVTGKRSEDMMMFQLESFATINTFPKSKWGIPEPPMEVIQQAKDGTCAGIVDTVIVPLCAFDKDCGRVGHGKGYYDSFLTRVSAANAAAGVPAPVTIGLAFDEQMVEEVPTEPHDRALDYIVTPTIIYSVAKS